MKSLLTLEQAATALQLLTDKQAGQLMRALVQVATTGTMPEHLPPAVAMAAAFINAATHEGDGVSKDKRVASARENGKKGGRPKTEKNRTETEKNQKNQNQISVFSVSDTENCPPPITPLYNTQEKNSLSHAQRACESDALESLDRLQTELLNSRLWLETVAKNQGLQPSQLREMVVDFVNYLRNTLTVETLAQARIHFVNQLPQQLRRIQEQSNAHNNGNNQANSQENGRARRAAAYQAAIARLAARSDRPAAGMPHM